MFDKISYYDEKNIWYILPWKTLMQLIVITKECLFQEGDLSNIIQIQTAYAENTNGLLFLMTLLSLHFITIAIF